MVKPTRARKCYIPPEKRHLFTPKEARKVVRNLNMNHPDQSKSFTQKGHPATWGKVWGIHSVMA